MCGSVDLILWPSPGLELYLGMSADLGYSGYAAHGFMASVPEMEIDQLVPTEGPVF